MARALQHHALASTLVILLAVACSPTGAFAAPPVLSVPGPQTVLEREPLSFLVTAVDPDGQAVVLYASNLPAGAGFTDHRNNSGTFSWTPGSFDAGFYIVFFLADDTFGGTDNDSVEIEVVNANSQPVLSPIGNRTVEQGSRKFVMLSGYDPDGDAVTYTASGLPSWARLDDYGDGTGTLTLAPTTATPPGTTSITVALSDGQAETRETFDVTVTATQAMSPPVLAPIGDQGVAEGDTRSVTISASDPDGNTLTWSVSLPGFANLTPTGSGPGTASARLDLAPGFCHAGTYSASIAVSDGSLQDSESFTVAVTNVNRAPEWAAPEYAASLPEGGTAEVSVEAHDPDEACGLSAPSLSLTGSDAGAALAASFEDHGDGTGTLSLAAAASGASVHHVTVRATDPSDPSATRDVIVTVTVTDVAVPLAGRAWSESDPIRLHTGKPRERIYLEPANASFEVAAVNETSLKLYAWDGAGSVPWIAPIAGSVLGGLDRDGNGVVELRMDFSKEDLRALLANVSERTSGTLALFASLASGAELRVEFGATLFPERNKVIRRVGPNPLNPEAVITVALAREGRLRVRVYDLSGRMVRTLYDSPSEPAGERAVPFNGRDDRGASLASGHYFVRVETADAAESSPITIVK
jgi:hypothetical protein